MITTIIGIVLLAIFIVPILILNSKKGNHNDDKQ